MNEFDNSMKIIKKHLRGQRVALSAVVLALSFHYGFTTGAWAGASLLAGGSLACIPVLMWLMRLRAEEQLKKSMTD